MSKDTMNFASKAEIEDGIHQQAKNLGIDIQSKNDSEYIKDKKFNEQVIQAQKQSETQETEPTTKDSEKTETRGRKKIELDTDLLFKLAECHCTMKEMSYIMGVSNFTLRNRFQDIIDRGNAAGKMRLRKAQYSKALEGNPVMLIWLGKNVLGQKDDPSNGEEDQPLPWKD